MVIVTIMNVSKSLTAACGFEKVVLGWIQFPVYSSLPYLSHLRRHILGVFKMVEE